MIRRRALNVFNALNGGGRSGSSEGLLPHNTVDTKKYSPLFYPRHSIRDTMWAWFLILLAIVLLITVTLCLLLLAIRYRNLGSLPISTSSTAYDREQYGHILNWDKHSMIINGKPTPIFGGEFHYWRVPDRSRWEPILRQYRDAGLNTIRIYFHWGYHSPDDGVYHFDGNRDIEYLLSLAEKLGLYVLAAPGPYICAETQAGGIPQWLVAKRHIRIRHALFSFFRLYDPQYSDYSAQWFKAILPIFARHQITSNPKGCVIALQIENESFEMFKWLPLGLHDDMRHLAKTAREVGMTVPLFTNDGWEAGSFVARPDGYRVLGKQSFGLDLYGFDKYIVFCPTSSPMAVITGGAPDKSGWGEWDVRSVEGLDSVERTVRGFGGGAAESPIFIPELQGGWFNHYTVKHSFDDVYDYYGEAYTNLVLNSVLAQGSTMFSYYMFYGGTNWGTIGDPDVYTSYDYSASIREHGFLSGRGRRLRLGLSFARSFSDLLVRTEPLESITHPHMSIKAYPDRVLHKQRVAVGTPQKSHFVFFRNFGDKEEKGVTVNVLWKQGGDERSVQVKGRLPYKDSFVAVAGYGAANGLRLILNTMPIYCRARVGDGKGGQAEVWIVRNDEKMGGELAFEGAVVVSGGTLDAEVRVDDGSSVVRFGMERGWTAIARESVRELPLYVVALSEEELYTFTPWFEGASSVFPRAMAWGVSSLSFDPDGRGLEIERMHGEQEVFLIRASDEDVPNGFHHVPASGAFAGLPFLFHRQYDHTVPEAIKIPELHGWEISPINITSTSPNGQLSLTSSIPWQPLPMKTSTRPAVDPIDLGYTSGHTLYRLTFTLSNPHPSRHPITLHLNTRHRATIYINGHIYAQHTTYSLATWAAGAKNGPDVGYWGGMQKWRVMKHWLREGVNEVVLVVESFGMNRQPFAVNDVRNQRGVLEGKVVGERGVGVGEVGWEVAGVDVRGVGDVFNSDGLPVQGRERIWKSYSGENGKVGTKLKLGVVSGLPVYWGAKLDLPEEMRLVGGPETGAGSATSAPKLHVPLRLHVTGRATAYISIIGINNTKTIIARYYGNADSVQKDFLIPEGLLQRKGNVVEVLAYGNPDVEEFGHLEMRVESWRVEDGWNGNLWSAEKEKGGKGRELIGEGERVVVG
ncbi:hypothetical protein HDV00_002326 [Rhizophlyctis rosea]|nr:hypothetical protein HDV00_002326 [Rhizophlyctis rosea]